MKNLTIKIHNTFKNVKQNNNKELIDNTYLPIHIEQKLIQNDNLLEKLSNKIIYTLRLSKLRLAQR
jgi:hypothetical protein